MEEIVELDYLILQLIEFIDGMIYSLPVIVYVFRVVLLENSKLFRVILVPILDRLKEGDVLLKLTLCFDSKVYKLLN